MEEKFEKVFNKNGFTVTDTPAGVILAQFEGGFFTFPIENKENLPHAILASKEAFDKSAAVDAIILERVKKGLQPKGYELVQELEAAHLALGDVYTEIVRMFCSIQHKKKPKVEVQVSMKPSKHLNRGKNDLATKYPQLASEWNNEKNGPLRPKDVTHTDPEEKRKFWWTCPYCGEVWDCSIKKRISCKPCPSCGKTAMKDEE